jgi:hypothetical protein
MPKYRVTQFGAYCMSWPSEKIAYFHHPSAILRRAPMIISTRHMGAKDEG